MKWEHNEAITHNPMHIFDDSVVCGDIIALDSVTACVDRSVLNDVR